MAMRSVANFQVNLGLFGFPVKVYKANNDPKEGVSFRQLHGACAHPINLVKRCGTCDVDVPHNELVKGIEVEGGSFLTFTDEEIKALKPEAAGAISIDGYVPDGEIDAAYLDGTVYLLAPDRGKNGKGDCASFVTWRDALAGRWAIAKVVMYGREHVVAIRATDRLLALHFLRTHDEIRAVADVPGYGTVPESSTPEHKALMGQLIAAKRIHLDDVVLESDAYADAVKALIASKTDGTPVPVTSETPVATGTTDSLLTMLKASLAASKGGA